MDIRTIREHTGLSQQQFATAFDIPVRTLQQWEQGRSNPPKYVIKMIDELQRLRLSPTKPEDHRAWDPSRFAIPEKTKWRICIRDPFQNCGRIYPIQQRKVKELLDDVTQDPTVKKVIVFGSSVTERCHQGSDVDLYVELEGDHNPIAKIHDFPYDIWTNHTVDERLFQEIAHKGVTVYG